MFILFMLLGCMSIYAADDNLITEQIIIKLDKAGTLPDKIISSEKYKITNLKITGEINGTDIKLLRDMAGCDWDGYQPELTEGKLSVLDLSEAKIVKGGKPYAATFCTSDNEIGPGFFSYCPSLAKIVLPSSVSLIGKYAFQYCNSLVNITFPSSLVSIGEFAFQGCLLKDVVLPSSVSSIGDYAFDGCEKIEKITFPLSLTSIGYSVFSFCKSLTTIDFAFGLKSIGKSAFYGCSSLTSLTIPSSVTSIGVNAFAECSSLTSLTIPSSVTSIGSSAFNGCKSLTNLTIPSSVTYIDDAAFKGCSGLKSLIIPSSVTTIRNQVFRGCTSLTSLTIPSSVTHIAYYAFSDCENLTAIYVNWLTPLEIKDLVFENTDMKKCTLYVPNGTKQRYSLDDVWRDFGNIIEYDPTGIDKVTISTDAKELSRYSVNGQRLSAPTKGLNIVKYSDGSVKKVAVQ